MVPDPDESSVIPRQSDWAANAVNMAAIDRAAGQSRYRHIVAWGKFLGFTPETVKKELDQAEAENAPVDAIQKLEGRWHTLDDIANETNRLRVEILANEKNGPTR